MKYKRNKREVDELRRPIRIAGITGGIASGKSVATDALAAAGYTVIDADEVSRELTAPGTPCERELMSMFPGAVSGGKLDRRALRGIISSDKAEMRKLNACTHPRIISEIKRRLSAPEKIVLSAPLLFETALSALCDCTVCITAPRKTRIARIVARDKVDATAAAAFLDAQIPDSYRATLCDFCVPSDTDIKTFREEILELFAEIFK